MVPSGDGAVVDEAAGSQGNGEKAEETQRSAGAGPDSASRLIGGAWFRTPRGVTTSAIVLIAAQLIWRATLLRHANFFQDDYQLIEQASGQSFGWHYLMQIHSVHLMPGVFALVKIVTAISPYSWPWAAGTTLFLQLLAGLAVLRMLRALFGTRPAILAPLALFLLTPLTIAALGWWAAALNVLPVEIAAAMAVAAHVEYLRSGKRGRAVEEVAWVVAGLAFFETAVTIPVLLLALTVCYFGPNGRPGPLRGALGATLRSQWRLWATYVAVVAGYGALYWTSKTGAVKIGTVSPVSHEALGFTGRLIFQTFVPGVFGGPWQWYAPQQNSYGWATPAGAAVWLTCIAMALVVLVTVRYRARAERAWLILLGWIVVADVAPLIAGRLNGLPDYQTIVLFAQDTRYVADAAPVLALCVALAFIPLDGETDPLRRPVRFPPVRRLAAVAAGAAIVIASLVSTQQYTGFLKGGQAQAYLSNAHQALRSGQSLRGFVDTYAMPNMILNSFGAGGYASQALAPLADSAQREVMASGAVALNNAVAFAPDGRLRPLVDATDASAPLGPSNGFGQCAGGSGPASITVSLPASLDWNLYVVRLDFTDGSPSTVDFGFGLGSRTLRLPSSLHRVYFDIVGNGNTMVLSNIASTSGFCVSRVAVGDPVFGA